MRIDRIDTIHLHSNVHFKTMVVMLFAVQVLFAQEITPTVPVPETVAEEAETVPIAEPAAETVEAVPIAKPVPVPEPVATPKPMSIAQVLSGTSLSKGCVEDFANVLGKNGFDMGKFMKELPVDVAKVKLQLKSPFGKPKDSDKTNSGLTVGCIKALPESPTEITSLLKDISLKMGLDLATSVVDNSIPTNVATESGSGGGMFKTVMSIGLATGGLGWVIYGIRQDGNVARYVDSRNGKAAVDAEKSRNMSYGIGAALLAGGLIVYLVF
jgi:hypothetical protein